MTVSSAAPEHTETQELYAAMVRFAQSHGMRRQELGSGWWWSEATGDECLLGEAVERLLEAFHGIDPRNAVPGEVEEFWG